MKYKVTLRNWKTNFHQKLDTQHKINNMKRKDNNN